MTTIAKIKQVISHLRIEQVEELPRWLKEFRSRQPSPTRDNTWLKLAVGAAKPGMTIEEPMSLSHEVE